MSSVRYTEAARHSFQLLCAGHIDPNLYQSLPLNPCQAQFPLCDINLYTAVNHWPFFIQAMSDIGFSHTRRQTIFHVGRCLDRFVRDKGKSTTHFAGMTFNSSSHIRCFIAGIADHFICQANGSSHIYPREWRLFVAVLMSVRLRKRWHPRNVALCALLHSMHPDRMQSATMIDWRVQCWILPSAWVRYRVERTENKDNGDIRHHGIVDVKQYHCVHDVHAPKNVKQSPTSLSISKKSLITDYFQAVPH